MRVCISENIKIASYINHFTFSQTDNTLKGDVYLLMVPVIFDSEKNFSEILSKRSGPALNRNRLSLFSQYFLSDL